MSLWIRVPFFSSLFESTVYPPSIAPGPSSVVSYWVPLGILDTGFFPNRLVQQTTDSFPFRFWGRGAFTGSNKVRCGFLFPNFGFCKVPKFHTAGFSITKLLPLVSIAPPPQFHAGPLFVFGFPGLNSPFLGASASPVFPLCTPVKNPSKSTEGYTSGSYFPR